jgi:hypothetical protein
MQFLGLAFWPLPSRVVVQKMVASRAASLACLLVRRSAERTRRDLTGLCLQTIERPSLLVSIVKLRGKENYLGALTGPYLSRESHESERSAGLSRCPLLLDRPSWVKPILCRQPGVSIVARVALGPLNYCHHLISRFPLPVPASDDPTDRSTQRRGAIPVEQDIPPSRTNLGYMLAYGIGPSFPKRNHIHRASIVFLLPRYYLPFA